MHLVIPAPSLVMLCGPAGSGKSTFVRRHFPETAVVSSDRCRAMIADDEADIRVSREAFELFHQIIDARLRHRRLTVADSTALQPEARKALRQLARRREVPAVLIVFDVPEETCYRWDARRRRQVGRAVIHRQWTLLQDALAKIPQEGYDRVVILGEANLAKASVRFARTSSAGAVPGS